MFGGIKYDWKALAALLANQGSDVQMPFFETFAQELRVTCGSQYAMQMQAHMIREQDGGLSETARDVYACLGMEKKS